MNESAEGVKGLECTDCHGEIPRVEDFDHAEEMEGAECADCHDGFDPGGSTVDTGKCMICHADKKPGALEHEMSAAQMHQHHIVENIVQCFFCHEKITHGEE
jgi:hypothetical protein